MITYSLVTGDRYIAHVNGVDVPVTFSRERGYEGMPGAPNGGRPHLAMYEAAIQYLGREPLRVLDFACGSGYGTAALRAAGHTVTGADASSEAIAFASAAYGDPFFVRDMGQPWPWDARSFEAVVCIEAIEHTERYREALAEAHRVLVPGGTLVISTPQGSQWKPLSPFHVKEWSMVEFADLLARAGFESQGWIPADCWLVICRKGER